MKRTNLNLAIIILIVAIATLLMGSSVMASSWSTDYYSSFERVEISTNNAGQTVYKVYDGSYTPKLEIFARGGNIWNNTTQVLLTDSNKGATYVAVDSDLNVYGINQWGYAVKYRKNFEKQDVPPVLSDYPGVTGFKKDQNGFVIGIYTSSGLYDIEEDDIVSSSNTNYNYNYNSYNYSSSNKYPYVVQSGNSYFYYTSSNYCYTYTLSGSRLKYKNSTISSEVEEVAFAKGYLLFITDNNELYRVKIGTDDKEFICYNFKSWDYASSSSYWVTEAEDQNGKSYSVTSSGYYYDDDDDDYPYVVADDDYYYYYKSSSKVYKYRLTNSGKLSYDGDTIATEVEEIQFAEGYLLYIKNGDCYSVKLGSTSYSKKYSDFIDWEFDDDTGLVESIETEDDEYDF